MRIGRRISWIVQVVAVWMVCVASARGDGLVNGYATTLTPVRPGAWTVLNGRVVNSSNEPVTGTLLVSEEANRDVQFTMPVWVPEKSSLQFPIPFITTTNRKDNRPMDLEVRLVSGAGGSEMDISKVAQPVAVDDGDSPTGIYWELGSNLPPDLVIQMRSTQKDTAGRPRKGRLASFDRRNRPFPSNSLSLLALSDLVIATPERLTTAQALAVRQWLVQGGHLWIMADRVTPEMARLIMGDDWTCGVAEETAIARMTIAEKGGQEFKSGPYEEPIRMVRLVSTGMEVSHSIDKWPAVMWRNVGRGQLLVTTFDIPAMGLETGKEPRWFQDIAARFLTPMRTQPPGAAPMTVDVTGPLGAMHEMASSLVGHEVVKRGPVMTILGLLCVLLLAAGLLLQRKSRLELLAPAALVFSLVATVAMLFLGAASKGSDPLTIVSVNEARVMPPSGLATYSGAADVYSPSAFDGGLSVRPGGWILPELANQAGHIVRLSWGELSPMEWQQLRFPSAATLRGTVGGAMAPDEKLAVSGTFGRDGFEGTINGKALADGQDLLLVGSSGRVAPRIVAGKLIAGAGDQLAPDDVAGPGIITHDREVRIKAIGPILAAAPREELTLYTWLENLGPGVRVSGQKAEERVRTLTAVPVTLSRPADNIPFSVPSAFMRISNYRIRALTNSWYTDRTGTFSHDVSTYGPSILRFELPAVVKAMRLETATLKVSLNAPDRRVRLFAANPGASDLKAVKYLGTEVNGPVAPIEVQIPAQDLKTDADGGLLVGLDVSAGKDKESIWQLNGVTLTVTGQMSGK